MLWCVTPECPSTRRSILPRPETRLLISVHCTRDFSRYLGRKESRWWCVNIVISRACWWGRVGVALPDLSLFLWISKARDNQIENFPSLACCATQHQLWLTIRVNLNQKTFSSVNSTNKTKNGGKPRACPYGLVWIFLETKIILLYRLVLKLNWADLRRSFDPLRRLEFLIN